MTKAERAAQERKAEHRATVRARRRRQLLNQRARDVELAKRDIIVSLPVLKVRQERGTPQPPSTHFPRGWTLQRVWTRQMERELAEAEGRA